MEEGSDTAVAVGHDTEEGYDMAEVEGPVREEGEDTAVSETAEEVSWGNIDQKDCYFVLLQRT